MAKILVSLLIILMVTSYLINSTSTLKSKEKVQRKKLQNNSTHADNKCENEPCPFTASDIKRIRKECLDAHNTYRQLHGTQPLKLNKKLNVVAQKWADHLAKTGKFAHSPENEYGENIYKGVRINNFRGNIPVKHFYEDEIPYFTFGLNTSDFMKTGHFTQVIWASSNLLGVGVAKDVKNNQIFFVCEYEPPGNYVGEYASQVPPPKYLTLKKKTEETT
uniref:SCP domain-containing protein n=1 Tax=Clastoptera arizonana TaxID=38151 RepID=A0A1B6DKS5_9HEMI